MKKENWIIALAAGAGVAAVTYKLLSTSIPKGATAVQPFDIKQYMGKWHEIARLPNRIEKNIKGLTEDYTLAEDGSIKVVTRGYNTKTNRWKAVTGKMKSAGNPEVGMLEVSYFGPFYLDYNVLAIDPDYQYALVSGSGLDYLWILSKETIVPEAIKTQFLETAKTIGFNVEKLEWV